MAMAASTQIEEKMRQFLGLIRWAALQQESEKDSVGQGLRTPYRVAGSIMKMPPTPTCTAKGSGLVVGLVGKRCKFDIYTPAIELLDLHVEVKGPNEDFCSEDITAIFTRRRSSAQPLSDEELQRLKEPDNLLGNGVLPTAPPAGKNTDVDSCRIPFDYQCVGEGHFLVSYLPRSEGVHFITIKWKGANIRGSPFQVMVADTLEKLNVESKNKLRHKRVCFNDNEAPRRQYYQTKSRIQDENEESEKENVEPVLGNVTAAVLNRSSKVHRSISTTAPAKLTKQATVTRRRVLRRVITKGGQEIVIHEVGATPSASRQNSNDCSRQTSIDLSSRQSSTDSVPSASFSRPGSPVQAGIKKHLRHQNKSFDFEIVCDTPSPVSRDGSQWCSKKQRSADHVAATMVETIMDDVFHMLQMKEVKEKLLKAQHLTFPRRDEPRPVIATKPPVSGSAQSSFGALLDKSLPPVGTAHDETKASILAVTAEKDELHMEDRDTLQKGPQPITQLTILNNLLYAYDKSSPEQLPADTEKDHVKNPHQKLTSTKSAPGKAKTHNRLGLTLSVPASAGMLGLCPPSLTNGFEKERMPPRLIDTDSLGKNDSEFGSNPSGVEHPPDIFLNHGISCEDVMLAGKMPLTKTLSDPARIRRKRLGLERSHTTPNSPTELPLGRSLAEQCAVSMEPDTPPGLKVIQSPSLKKRCYYNSQAALDESSRSETDYNNLISDDPAYDDMSRADRPMMWRTRRLAHRLSSSLPTLSRNWTAFEIDPDDDSLTIEEMEALSVAAQRQPKRATLPTSHLSNTLQTFQDIGSEEDKDADMLTIPYASARPSRTVSPGALSLCTPSPPSPNVSPADSRISSRLNSLLRQDIHCLQKVSEEDSLDIFDKSKDGRLLDESEIDNARDILCPSPGPGDPWHMTNTPEFISRRKSLEPQNRRLSPRALYVKVPIAKMDRWTQVEYGEIKGETGWNKPMTCVHPRRRMVRKEAIETFSSEDSQTGQSRGANNLQEVPQIICDTDRDSQPLQNRASTLGARDPRTNLLHPLECSDTLQPVRQSTVDTIDSGIVISPPVMIYSRPKPRFISGHRAVTRSKYRGKIALDPRLVSGSPNASHDEDGVRSPISRRRTMSPGLRFSRSVSGPRRQKRCALSQEEEKESRQHRSPRILSTKRRRRVHFSRKVMLYRRSSSKSRSWSSRSISHETPTPTLGPNLSPLVQHHQGTLSPPGVVKPGTSNTSAKHGAYKGGRHDSWDVDISPEVKIHLQENSPPDAQSNAKAIQRERLNKNPFFSEYFAQLDGTHTHDDEWEDDTEDDDANDTDNIEDFISMNKIGTLDRGYCSLVETASVDILPAHYSQDTYSGGSETCSEIAQLTSDPQMDPLSNLNLPEDFRFHRPSISIEDEVFIPLPSLVFPPDDYLPDGGLDHEPNSSVSDTSDFEVPHHLPDPFHCRAFGAGLNMGKVGTKNNFQVLTETKGNDCLSVSIKGPRPRTVSETSVTFTGDNLYEILYEVTRPGHYCINVKWGDFHIPNSPFLCKVSY